MNQSDLERELKHVTLRATSAEKAASCLMANNQKVKKELAEAVHKAELAEMIKSRFLANISHELRTPMNGILGMSELLNSTSLDESQTHFTKSINRSTESLLSIVNDLLDISSLDQGKIELEENVFFLSKLINDACSSFETRAKRKKLRLVWNTDNCTQSPVIGDEQRVKQVLCKLIDNAIKFTDKGEIVVSQDSDSETNIYRISVEDTGTGIAPDDQTEIFKAFSQGDNTSTRRHGGTGLGLSIANALASLMGGEVTVESTPGKGSRFTLKCSLEQGNAESIRDVGYNTLSGIKVLVVDDLDINREILELQLQQWGIEVQSADSGKQALVLLNKAQAENTPFRLAILDLNMPDMDGLELAQHIQNAEFSEDLRVMMLTSSTVDLSLPELQALGIHKSMMKPARQATVHDAIVHLLAGDLDHICEPAITKEKTISILLTEDDPINQEVATIMLESLGHEVTVADNGTLALEALTQKNNFDLVLMDCQMPVMDGFSATRAIRKKGIAIPIIALTANATEGDRELCIDAGMNDYLTKPIYQSALARIVQEWASESANKQSEQIDRESVTVKNFDEKIMNIQIDESALDSIRALQRPGKPDILARIVNMYMEKSPELISAIEEGVAANDKDKVKMAAHTLKSSSAYVGASALAEVCGRVESNASNDELASTVEDIAMINSGFESVVSQIKQYG